MSNDLEFKIANLDKWEAWLKTCEEGEVMEMNSRIVRTMGLRTLEYAQDLCPVRSGRLAGSLSFGSQDNVFELKVGKTTKLLVGTAVEYAAYVNDGFSQENRKGKYIPGYWSSGTFHYDPNSKTGMVLTGKVIEGARYFDKAIQYLEDDIDTIAEFELKRLYAKLTG